MRWAIIFIILFLIIGSYIIIKSNSINLEDKEGKVIFAKKFGVWAYQLGKNTKDVVGLAVKKNWLPEEKNNLTRNITIVEEK